MNDNDVSSYYKEALATDSFTVHNNFLNMLLKDASALGMERHYCYFKDSKNADLKRILGNGFLKRGKEGVFFLKEKLKTETDALFRGFIVSAMRQIFFRHKETKQQIVDFIYVKIPEETYNELLAIMIVVLQDLTKVKFGLKEDSCSGEISGDIAKAKDKVLKKIKK